MTPETSRVPSRTAAARYPPRQAGPGGVPAPAADKHPPRTWPDAAASVVSEAFTPAAVVTALFLALGWHAGRQAGLAWGAAGAGCASIGPYAFIRAGVARGRYASHHLTAREDRRVPLLAAAAMIAVGIPALYLAGAPRDIVAAEAAMLAGLVVTTPITLIWKISFHAGVAAAASAILVVVYGPPLTAAAAVIPVIGWSRVHLGDHTRAQVIAAIPIGAASAAALFLAVR